MKKQFLTLMVALATTLTFGQKFEGKVTLEMEYSDLPPELEQYESMLPKEMTQLIKGEKLRIEQSTMMGTNITVMDTKNKTGFLLMDMMGQKKAIKMDAETFETDDKEVKTEVKTVKGSKTIAGYKCKKALVTGEDGTEIEIWYTEDLPNISQPGNAQSKVPGYPMQYTMNQNGMGITMTVSKIEKQKIADSKFEIPEGYDVTTMEEFKESMGGMGQ